MGNVSRGSGWRDGERRGAHDSVTWRGNSGEESRAREGRGEWETGLAMLLTATWSFWGTCAMVESGRAAGGRGAAAKVAARLGFTSRGGCGICRT
jgi:hypothetical protein